MADVEGPVPISAERGLEELFAREALSQVRRAALLLGSEAEANDVVQEAFLRVFERWADIDDPGPYLHRTVLNLCRDRARRRGRHRRVLARLVPRGDGVAERDVLDDVLDRLPFQQRAAVVLRYWDGLSVAEIAEELDCRPGSVGPWINRALRRMRKELE